MTGLILLDIRSLHLVDGFSDNELEQAVNLVYDTYITTVDGGGSSVGRGCCGSDTQQCNDNVVI